MRIKQYINNYPEPFRSQAKTNVKNQWKDKETSILDSETKSPFDALQECFDWLSSTEGFDYWQKFSKTLSK